MMTFGYSLYAKVSSKQQASMTLALVCYLLLCTYHLIDTWQCLSMFLFLLHNSQCCVRDCTCKGGGGWCKKGPLKLLTFVRGAWKSTTDFPLKIEFTCFLWGWPMIFMAKRGALKFFCSLKGGPRKIFVINIFCIWSPLTSVCERSLMLGATSKPNRHGGSIWFQAVVIV